MTSHCMYGDVGWVYLYFLALLKNDCLAFTLVFRAVHGLIGFIEHFFKVTLGVVLDRYANRSVHQHDSIVMDDRLIDRTQYPSRKL